MKRVENSVNGEPRFSFNGKMIAPLSEEMSYINGKGEQKFYKLTTIEFVNQHGEIKKATASVPKGNYSKGDLNVGTEYLCTATLGERDGKKVVYINMSHLLAGAGFADIGDFDFEEVQITNLTGVNS